MKEKDSQINYLKIKEGELKGKEDMISSLSINLDLIRQYSNNSCIEANLFDDNNY